MDQIFDEIRQHRESLKLNGQILEVFAVRNTWLDLIQHAVHEARENQADFREVMVQMAALVVVAIEQEEEP